ncbi:hypothetical protein ABMA28_007727 [Loxostege sticticalis]|uniref:Uncharacterized protein n=1 Tax=Loxostege sticticalis TaxID=481309 RepID=A0ABD0SKU1_LOXSC
MEDQLSWWLQWWRRMTGRRRRISNDFHPAREREAETVEEGDDALAAEEEAAREREEPVEEGDDALAAEEEETVEEGHDALAAQEEMALRRTRLRLMRQLSVPEVSEARAPLTQAELAALNSCWRAAVTSAAQITNERCARLGSSIDC